MANYLFEKARSFLVRSDSILAAWSAPEADETGGAQIRMDNDGPIFIVDRRGAFFDTQTIPVGVHVVSATLHCALNGFVGMVADYVRVVRADSLDWDFPLSSFGYLKGTTQVLGSRFVDWVGSEEVDIVLSDPSDWVVIGGYTPLGFRLGRDIDYNPPDLGDVCFIDVNLSGFHLVIETTQVLEIVTLACTEKTSSSFVANGEITYIGVTNATKRGFEWGTSIAGVGDNQWYEEGSFGVGTFSHEITGLDSETDYYFRAIASDT